MRRRAITSATRSPGRRRHALAGSALPEHCRQRELLHRTLLLVDDDRAVLQTLRQALGRDGYEVLGTTDPADALDLLAQHRVGVIVSDFRMPNLTGIDLLQRVKTLNQDIVRILLSGYGEGQSIAATPGDGSVQKLLTKPWDVTLLRKHIAEAFQQFECVDVMVPPRQGWINPDAACADMRVPRTAYSSAI